MENYNKMFNLAKEEAEVIDAVQTLEKITEEPEEYLMGKVTAKELYVRTAPSKDAKPYESTLKQNAEVMIDESKSTDDFYSVTTESGIEGFCMKQFIAVE